MTAKFHREKARLVGNDKPSVLCLAEGMAEVGFLASLLGCLGAEPARVAIFCLQGIRKDLAGKVKTIVEQDNFHYVRTLLFVVDAEDKPDGRLAAIRDACLRTGLCESGAAFDERGRLSRARIPVAVVMAPSLTEVGRIETLIMKELACQPEFPCLESLAGCLRSRTGATFSEKGTVQFFITARNETLCGVGRAFEAGLFDVMHEAYALHRETVQTMLAEAQALPAKGISP